MLAVYLWIRSRTTVWMEATTWAASKCSRKWIWRAYPKLISKKPRDTPNKWVSWWIKHCGKLRIADRPRWQRGSCTSKILRPSWLTGIKWKTSKKKLNSGPTMSLHSSLLPRKTFYQLTYSIIEISHEKIAYYSEIKANLQTFMWCASRILYFVRLLNCLSLPANQFVVLFRLLSGDLKLSFSQNN